MKLNLPVILLNNAILMPTSEVKFEFEDEVSKSIIEESILFHEANILVVTKTSLEENIITKDLIKIGTVAHIERKLELPNGKVRVILKGISRAKVLEYLNPLKDTLDSIVMLSPKLNVPNNIKLALINKLQLEISNYIEKVPNMSNSLISLIENNNDLDSITDIIVNHLPLDINRKIKYLITIDPTKRTEMILEDLYKQEQLFKLEDTIDNKVKKELEEDQKKFYLKEKIKLLEDELGDISPFDKEISELKSKVETLDCSEAIKNKIYYEIDRYSKIPTISPEVSIVRNYIDLIINLPWNHKDKEITEIEEIRKSLDNNHFGLENVKERIIEYLALKKLSKDITTPIICLVGPPGVGKTTFAYSIASSIGRSFVKISLGGIDDEAFIKGHSRTYIGATSGKIIDGIRRAKTSNPVFLIDEIDKMAVNHKGDPQSALLEVLDPSQNKHFIDNYLDEEYDLSQVMFITTANDINLIPEPLKDRLEIININGYTELEKINIVKKYIIPNVCESHGIDNIKISDKNILEIIRYYTHESGLRELQRLISKIVRKVALQNIDKKSTSKSIRNIEEYLGKRKYENDLLDDEIGLVNGLSYTSSGGDIIPIEVNYYKGNGEVIVTGSVGDMLQESVKIALSYIKANYKTFKLNNDIFNSDIHINIPNISIKKEGPSAGVAITTSIISALSNLKINKSIAMTGEITLRGNILRVGGIKEKIIGAYINNIDTVFIPASNLNDLEDVPNEVLKKIKFIPVKHYNEIYNYLINRTQK